MFMTHSFCKKQNFKNKYIAENSNESFCVSKFEFLLTREISPKICGGLISVKFSKFLSKFVWWNSPNTLVQYFKKYFEFYRKLLRKVSQYYHVLINIIENFQ